MKELKLLRGLNDMRDETILKVLEKPKTVKRIRWPLVLIAAVILVTGLMGAAVFTRWSRTMQSRYNPSEEVKKQAEDSGLSVMFENTESAEGNVISVTERGITVTAVQTLVDNRHADIVFRIEGFPLPEGKIPQAVSSVTVDGDPDFYGMMSRWFFDGITKNENGKMVYAATGLPVRLDQNGVIRQYMTPDGSLEYIYYIDFDNNIGDVDGKEIEFHFSEFGYESGDMSEHPVDAIFGDWVLRWKLKRSFTNVSQTLNAPIGDTGVTLLDAEVGQVTIKANYQLSQPFEGFKTMEDFPQEMWGVRTKVGEEIRVLPRMTDYSEETLHYYAEYAPMNAILNLGQVESLMFCKDPGSPEGGFYYIPVQK